MYHHSRAATDTSQAIIEAAGKEFSIHGFEGTSFSRIAEAMGRPKSAIGYHLFPSKHSLATAVIERQQQRWIELNNQLSTPPGLDRLVTLLLTTTLDARSCSIAAGAVRLLHEFGRMDIDTPRGFDWTEVVLRELNAEAQHRDPAESELCPPTSARLLLNATFGLLDGSRQLTDSEFLAQLRGLWGPLLSAFGIAHAPSRIAQLEPMPRSSFVRTGPEEEESDTSPTRGGAGNPSQASVRSWARANGFKVGERGRLSKSIRDAYDDAHAMEALTSEQLVAAE
ncbi:Lsr2 family DNA-binding protein [Curtobacterium flaccumfaciens]|uniref:Lsr2 family DNA-binding protein n=1 Tax=Curtobacterium flaccumfaciens TaxID=2035 RepID=UPI001E4B38B1|nr:histone-like nucleoid-structuring protein Lsr2 [Curtobacterium allii]MCE0459764.1 Lsr2 family protein [Curtobacterium allii]